MNQLLSSETDGVMTLIINRPEVRNALSPEVLASIREAVGRAEASNSQIRAIVIKGAGGEAFSAGYHIPDLSSYPISAIQEDLTQTFDRVSESPIPVIAMIEGHCIGAGFELAISCDIRIAADTAKFRLPPARLGALYAPAGMYRFVQRTGVATASYLFLTAALVEGTQAQHFGLVHEALPGESIGNRVEELAGSIARHLGPLAVGGMKRILAMFERQQRSLALQRSSEIDSIVDVVFSSSDYQEGRTALIEGRRPHFTGH